ncbi:MAG: tRNA (adenosine(37)-N6)-threonylcarbamoyltransferase complex transferase subunit TsaD [Planctomycetaceae bacterium]|nr:tRNA (adenosine(37)-N6)-threonylcarbamoyltransferase complex transferase subunit TsaD [Planctomycetaceae bacterium]
MKKYLLSIESTCDETAAAVIDEDRQILSSVVSSQIDLHEKYGGVVPEIAARAHLDRILPVINDALQQSGVSLRDLNAVAVATQPGLVGSLLVGVTAAKTLAMLLKVPLISIDHIAAHLYACQLDAGEDVFPAVGLVVSGGHTNLYDCKSALNLQLLGSTVDDAAGEAFDKVAQILGLSYPGGPAIEETARNGDSKKFRFPRAFLKEDRLAFSFSGLKTAVLYQTNGQPGAHKQPPELTPQRVADLAASFQQAVVDVLVEKCKQAIQRVSYETLCIGGGVAANSLLRAELDLMCKQQGIRLIIAPMKYCTDNAAMGAIAWEKYEAKDFCGLDLDPTPGLVRAR